MRWLALLALCACSEDYLRVDFDGEIADHRERAIALGLVARVEVTHVTMSAGDEEPNEDFVAATDITLRLEGATRVPCDSAFPSTICIVAGDVDEVVAHFDTPHGEITAKRRVAHALRLSRYSPRWATPDDRTQILVGEETDCHLHVREQGGERVSGRASMIETTGDIVFDGQHVTGNTPGMATIAISERPDITPLQIKIVPDEDTALASIAKFRVDRMFFLEKPDGLDSLTAYTDGPVGGHVFEAFDADDFWVIPNLPYKITGPDLVTHPWPVAEGPCTTNDYCFLRGTINSGTTMSFVELTAGSTTQRFPVKVVHGAY